MLSNDSVFVFHLGQLNPIFWYHIKDVYFAGWNEGQSFRAPGCHIYGSFTLLGSYSTKVWMLNLILKHLSLTMGTMGTLWLLFDWSISCAAERFSSKVGGQILEVKNGTSAPITPAMQAGCRGDVWGGMWHHVILAARLLHEVSFTVEQDSQKCEETKLAPQSEKWRGHWPPAPLLPLPMVYIMYICILNIM